MPTITPEQFDALSELLRLRAGPAQVVVRMVLVDGATVPDAAREVAMEYRAAFQAVQRARRGLDLAHRATGVKPSHSPPTMPHAPAGPDG